MKKIFFILPLIFLSNYGIAQKTDIETIFKNPPASAKPWVFWYWMHGAVSKEGITADLEAMKDVGIGGAYLMPIKDTSSTIPFQPQVRQLTPEWWAMVKFALQEAKRLNLQLGMHVSDGFALAGGPWITPELSMQKLVWTKAFISGEGKKEIILSQPEVKEKYYKDIAVYAYPANYDNEIVTNNLKPVVTSSDGSTPSFLADTATRQTFRSDSDCWIQYSYSQPITVRQVKIKKQNNAYQSQRFIIQKSDDGVKFTAIDTLHPPRHGWQDWEEPYTHATKTFTAQHIRFVWQKEGTEPGSEDLDAAKWKAALRVQGIYISDEPVINNYEAKNGSMWRIAGNTTNEEVAKVDAVPLNKIINLTDKLSITGKLNWMPPTAGNWVVVRIGHTSTGYTNATAGGGKGLECDKFSAAATTLQFKNWFEKFYTNTDMAVAKDVIKVFHIDSWECGSQNWSTNFVSEFKKKRGYDLSQYLLVMTGTPIADAVTSEKVLLDVRKTIAELMNDQFYKTLKNLAHAKGCQLSAESIAPTFVSDGLKHYQYADIPMGEFWVNSPTHDKPNDMLDAISGAHIYGKNIVQAEAFTTLRSNWGEHPANLKGLGDRAFAAGINKLSLHVFMHSPWLDKKPGMTLDGIGLFYQRGQTWFKQSKAWIEYLTRCQALLQAGKPVVDIGVFIGEELPSRSVLPDRLISILPGLFGTQKVEAEEKRLQNEGQPQRIIPDGVTHSANMADPANYIDGLNGYSYDCFNPDVLMRMVVKNGRVVTPGGTSYAVLVIPGKHPMNPNGIMSEAVKRKLLQLANNGAKIVADKSLYQFEDNKIVSAPYVKNSFEELGVRRDVEIIVGKNSIAWSHRQMNNSDLYFISNQINKEQPIQILFRVRDKKPEGWNPVSGNKFVGFSWHSTADGIMFFGKLYPNQSIFLNFAQKTSGYEKKIQPIQYTDSIVVTKGWDVEFDNISAPVIFNEAISWTMHSDPLIRNFSGTAIYRNKFIVTAEQRPIASSLAFDSIFNIATVRINGIDCGTIWTPPYYLDISKAIKTGENNIEVEVTNTWRNRLIGDELLPDSRKTWFNSPYKLKEMPLLPAGLVGKAIILIK